jgi:hypothetical protein
MDNKIDRGQYEKDMEEIERINKYRYACRDYLMGVEPDKLTVEDALEALGFGRDGLITFRE